MCMHVHKHIFNLSLSLCKWKWESGVPALWLAHRVASVGFELKGQSGRMELWFWWGIMEIHHKLSVMKAGFHASAAIKGKHPFMGLLLLSRTKSNLPSTNDPSLFPWLLVHVRQNVICIGGGSVHVLLPGRALSVSRVTVITKHFFCCSLKAVWLILRALSHNITNQFWGLWCERGLITRYYLASTSVTTKKGALQKRFLY